MNPDKYREWISFRDSIEGDNEIFPYHGFGITVDGENYVGLGVHRDLQVHAAKLYHTLRNYASEEDIEYMLHNFELDEALNES